MKKLNPTINKIQFAIPFILASIFAVGFFVDLREYFGYQNRVPSSLVIVLLVVCIVWAIVNFLVLKNEFKYVFISCAITIIPFLLVELIFGAHWLALFTGAVFITLPLTAFSTLWFLISTMFNKKAKKD